MSGRTSFFNTPTGEATFRLGKPPGTLHRFYDPKCPSCYTPEDAPDSVKFPLKCPCGGLIHQEFGEHIYENNRGELIPDGPVEVTYKLCDQCGPDCGSKITSKQAGGAMVPFG